MADVEFAVRLPQWSERATPAAMKRIATAAEDLGFDAVWRGDHVAYPEGTADVSPWDARTNAYDAFTALAYVAGVTDDLRIGTNVCIVPYRHPVHLAKLALSLDALTDGRFDFGVAPGWHEAEFEVLDVPFPERGALTDEFLDLFERVRADDVVAFDGPYHSFRATGFHPRPVQEPIPIWVGGDSGASFRRVAEYGVGWTNTMTPTEVRESRPRLLAAWEDYDRDGEPRIAASQSTHVGTGHELDRDRPMVGDPSSIAAGVHEYVEAGVTRIDLKQEHLPIDDRIEQLERFRDEVLGGL